jgi:antitoxin component YwqK of YwqJK toxin-antitoxin module
MPTNKIYITIILVIIFLGFSCQRARLFKTQNETIEVKSINKNEKEIRTYFPNGRIMSIGFYNNGLKEGRFIWCYMNGEISKEVYYSNDLENGEYREFHQNGKLKIEGEFLNGKKTNTWKEYYENGNVKNIGFFYDGIQINEYNTFYANGLKRMSAFYLDGIPAYYEEFDSIGNRIGEKRVVQINIDKGDSVLVGDQVMLTSFICGPKTWTNSSFALTIYNENNSQRTLYEVFSRNDTCNFSFRVDSAGIYFVEVMMMLDKKKAFAGNKKIVVENDSFSNKKSK